MSEPTIARCVEIVCELTGMPPLDIASHRRDRHAARPRQLVMWLARHATRRSLPEIGRALDRDHTTVIHGIAAIDRLRAESNYYRALSDRALHAALADPRQAEMAV